ncbi:protein-lysine N-methyltransferase SMYD4 isoform X2 [Augochlora pura]
MKWDNVLDELMGKLTKIHALKDKINREDELMSHLWNDQNTRILTSLWLKYYYSKKELKCIRKAQTFKNTGNKQFQSKNYLESIQSYTKCALYAPVNSREFSVAFANRSASLFYLNRYNDCIKDIETATMFNYPKELQYKLHLRMMDCYLKLGNPDLAKEIISKIRASVNDPDYIAPSMKDDIEKRISGVAFNETCIQDESKSIDGLLDLKSTLMFNENPNFPHASSSIDKTYNEELGRHVTANRFIKKGEILFIEKPVSFVVLNHDTMDHFCHHCCCLHADLPVPCTKCLNTFYCTANCLNEAWSLYHCWECPGSSMDIWKEIGIGHLALRVLLTCTTTTDTIKLDEVNNLVTNFDKASIEALIVYGIAAVMLTTYLLEYTDFFETSDINDYLTKNSNIITDNNKHLCVSSLLLRHILQLICNGHAISSLDIQLNQNDFSVNENDIVAAGIYPSASIMNHSCDPNIINIFRGQYLIVRASKDIAPTEDVFNTYGPHYRHISTEQRQNILSKQYFFTCKCVPCTQPNLQYFLDRFTAMNCSKCNGALCIIKNSLLCLDCFDNPKVYQQNKIEQAEKLFKDAESCISQGKIEKALEILNKCLNIRRTVLYKYNADITTTLISITKLYMAKDAIECMESTITAITEQFGSSSIRLLNIFDTLTNLYIMYLQNSPDITASTYKSLLATTNKYLDQLEELANFNYGSWSNVYKNIRKKRNKLISIV